MARLSAVILLSLALLTLLGMAPRVEGDDQPTSSSASASTEATDPAVLALCAQATNCSSCLDAWEGCGWCGSSDSSGRCLYCSANNCNCSSFYSNVICPDRASDAAMGILTIALIIVGSVAGFCCLVVIVAVGVFCMCCRTPGHRGYIIAGGPTQVQHHYHHHQHQQPPPLQPLYQHQHHDDGKHYSTV